MPGESMIQWLIDHLGSEIARKVSGGSPLHYAGLWDSTNDYDLNQVVRYISTGDGDDDCGDSLWYSRQRIAPPPEGEENPTPCSLSGDPDTPWPSVPDGPIDLFGVGNPNQLEEGTDDDGPVPAPTGSTWRDLATGDLYTRTGDTWTATAGGGGGIPVVVADADPTSGDPGDLTVYALGTFITFASDEHTRKLFYRHSDAAGDGTDFTILAPFIL